MLMEIHIDHDKCKLPVNCRKCLQICPQCVFKLHPTHIRRFVEIPPEDWELHISFPDLCSGCMECVNICPERAIKVRVKKKDKPSEQVPSLDTVA
jgi:NAD-dependent dihydropyrimidine dehydrogenase PreA subunit